MVDNMHASFEIAMGCNDVMIEDEHPDNQCGSQPELPSMKKIDITHLPLGNDDAMVAANGPPVEPEG